MDRLEPGAREDLLSMGRVQSFRRRDLLLRQGEPGDFVLVLEKGRVKVSGQDGSGATTILDVGVPGDLHGEVAVVTDEARIADVTALEECRVRRIAAQDFDRFLNNWPSATRQVLTSVARWFALAQRQRSVPRTASALSRVAERLTYLVALCGRPATSGAGWVIDVPLTRDELAQFIPLGRTRLTEVLDTLRKRGIVTASRMSLTVLNRDQLAAIARYSE